MYHNWPEGCGKKRKHVLRFLRICLSLNVQLSEDVNFEMSKVCWNESPFEIFPHDSHHAGEEGRETNQLKMLHFNAVIGHD